MNDDKKESELLTELLFVGTREFCRSFCGDEGYSSWRMERNIKSYLSNNDDATNKINDLKKVIKVLRKNNPDVLKRIAIQEESFSHILKAYLFENTDSLINLFLKRR